MHGLDEEDIKNLVAHSVWKTILGGIAISSHFNRHLTQLYVVYLCTGNRYSDTSANE